MSSKLTIAKPSCFFCSVAVLATISMELKQRSDKTFVCNATECM